MHTSASKERMVASASGVFHDAGWNTGRPRSLASSFSGSTGRPSLSGAVHTATTFSPDDPVTRGQLVTFLWRLLGMPAPAGPSGFPDVMAESFYADAVAWEPIWHEGAVVGYVTSGGYSHYAQKSIAYGFLPIELATEGREGRGGENDQRVTPRVGTRIEQKHDQRQRQRHDDGQP